MAAMATWTDAKIDSKEENFLSQLGSRLDLSELHVHQAASSIESFYKKFKEDYPDARSKKVAYDLLCELSICIPISKVFLQ